MYQLNKLFNLSNKVAVVIGGAGYLCSSMVKGLYNNNCKIVVIDIRKKKIDLLKKKLNISDKEKFLYFVGNALDKKNLIKIKKQIYKKFKKVDILINGAGINSPTSFLKISERDWNKVISSHLTTTLNGCQVFGEEMLKNRNGSIINISSASAGPPLSKAFAYSVAKSGIKNLSQNLAREWAKRGVRVNCIRPGFFPTEWNRKNFLDKKRIKRIFDHTPMNRFGNPDELIGATLWLSSDASSFVTGSEVTVDGGFSCMTI